MKDPYAALGLSKTATAAQIKDAFKTLTRKHHPDLHPGDATAEEKFKDISIANDLLSDPEKRRRFDAGEIDATGAEVPQQRYYRDYANGGTSNAAHAQQDGFASDADLQDFLNRAFGGARPQSGRQAGGRQGFGRGPDVRGGADPSSQPQRGEDVSYALPVSFLDAATGSARTITLPDGKSLSLTIPEGAEDRQMLRLKGQGMPGFNGGATGDAYVELHIEPHAFFERRDDNIHVEVPITLREAVLGAKIDVPTIGGPVAMSVPKGSNTGKVLRLRDKGVLNRRSGQRGHQMITLKVVLPTADEPELTAFLEHWHPAKPQNPRKEMLA